jgi:hypothetical protein
MNKGAGRRRRQAVGFLRESGYKDLSESGGALSITEPAA